MRFEEIGLIDRRRAAQASASEAFAVCQAETAQSSPRTEFAELAAWLLARTP
jgi:hypothetical protein